MARPVTTKQEREKAEASERWGRKGKPRDEHDRLRDARAARAKVRRRGGQTVKYY